MCWEQKKKKNKLVQVLWFTLELCVLFPEVIEGYSTCYVTVKNPCERLVVCISKVKHPYLNSQSAQEQFLNRDRNRMKSLRYRRDTTSSVLLVLHLNRLMQWEYLLSRVSTSSTCFLFCKRWTLMEKTLITAAAETFVWSVKALLTGWWVEVSLSPNRAPHPALPPDVGPEPPGKEHLWQVNWGKLM